MSRVSQLDATLLDQQLLELLTNQIPNASPELKLLISTVLFKFNVWDNSISYGGFLQNLRYVGLSKKNKLVYYLLTVVVHYLTEKSITGILFSKIYKSLSLINYITFIYNGRYESLVHRLLKIKTIQINKRNAVSFEFQNRQLVWNTLLECFVYLAPLYSFFNVASQTPISLENPSNCAICHNKITTPYKTNCGHLYCFVCITKRLELSQNLTCHCNQIIKYAEPL